MGGGVCVWGMCCSNLFWTFYIYIYTHTHTRQRDVSFLLCKVNNQSQLINNCLTWYVDTITSTKGYKNHTFEPLTNKLHKQVYSLQKQCSFHIFLIGTGPDPCFRDQDGQEWQQSSPQSPKPYPLSHTPSKSKKTFLVFYHVLWWCTIKLIWVTKVSVFLKI